VAQIEELGFDQFWKRKVELQTALEAYCNSRKYQFSVLLVTDVNRQCSLLMMVGDSELIENIKYPRIEPGIFELKDIVSRKKQLLPYLTHSLKQFRR
jgi:manganese-dependent inorganic pyrophosphatase